MDLPIRASRIVSVLLLITALFLYSCTEINLKIEDKALIATSIYMHCVLGLRRGAIGDFEDYTKIEQIKYAMDTINAMCTQWTWVWYQELVDKMPLKPEEMERFNNYKSNIMEELETEFITESKIKQM